MKVILVYMDTLRADHLGCYGYRFDTSPDVDRFADEGVLFESAYPTDVPTQPSFTSALSGQRGIRTGVVSHSPTEDLADRVPWLPHIVSAGGIETAAVSTLYLMKKYFARGYNTYMNPVAGDRSKTQQITGEEINSYATQWLKANYNKDFFLFVHYWDPHCLYLPPRKYRRMFYKGNPTDRKNKSREVCRRQIVWVFGERHVEVLRKGITDLKYVVAQYDGEIRYVNDCFARLVGALQELGIYDETLVILTSDHGESMGEHQLYFDHFDVYEPTARVPLILRWPKRLPAGKRVKALVQNIDMAPTILQVFGIKAPSEFQGRSLLPLATGKTTKGYQAVYCNQGLWRARRMMRNRRWKLIKTIDKSFWESPPVELYDLQNDPGEKRNLAKKRADITRRMELEMAQWLEAQLGRDTDPLRRIAELGLPTYAWVRRAAQRRGEAWRYEEWRAKVDAPQKGEV
jgi:arylsulfatase A-like enzyme